MARYLVGAYNDTWDFNTAYQHANDGDTIEFQEGFMYQLPMNSTFTITKNLHIVGHVSVNQEGTTLFNNTINARLLIKGGATVTFEKIWFQMNDEYAMIQVSEKSTLQLDTIFLNSTISQNKTSLIFATGDSKVFINNAGNLLEGGNFASLFLKAYNSSMEISNSTLHLRVLATNNAVLRLENTYIGNYSSNTINMRNSELHLKQVTIEGGSAEKDYPAVWGEHSKIISEHSVISQPRFESCLFLKDNSSISSKYDEFTSVSLNNSRMMVENSSIREVLKANDASYCVATGEVNFVGENDTLVDLLVANKSGFVGGNLLINRTFSPNIRLQNQAYLFPENIQSLVSQQINYDISEDSRYFVPEMRKQNSSSNTPKNVNSDSDIVPPPTSHQPQEKTSASAFEQLQDLMGLESVKREVNNMIQQAEFRRKRIAEGYSADPQSLHSVFMGNPGTGKTTVARLLGEVLFENGALAGDEFKFVEATESDLISSNVGGTAEQTKALLEQAKGGILFIDEAYTLNKEGSVNFGIDAINTILKYMEDHRDEIMVIFAGYTKEMEQFLETNPGLKSRVPNTFIFEDYTPDEIVQIGMKNLTNSSYQLEDSDYYARKIRKAYKMSLDKSNARWIRNFNEQLTKAMATRVQETDSRDLVTIVNQDIDAVLTKGKYRSDESSQEDAFEELQQLIGIPRVKEQIQDFISLAEVNQLKEDQGRDVGDFTLHSMFLGNPGTGKTTVARIIGKILYQKGLIAQNKFIEVSRSDLVAGYIGQTELKTKEVLKSALGGVLFIDEAYALSGNSDQDFGKQAIDEILKFMEDHRRDMVIILAGYTKEMGEFLQMNSGLRSRIPNIFDFEDYTPDEIVQIGLLGLHKQGYKLDEDFYSEIVKQNYSLTNDFSNGRWIRNLNEKLITIQARRIAMDKTSDLTVISSDDLGKIRGLR